MGVDPFKCTSSAGRQAQLPLPAVFTRLFCAEQALAPEPAENPAQIPCVQAKLLTKLTGRARIAMSELIQHSRFGQRKRPLEVSLTQHPDPPGIEPVEGANDFHPSGQLGQGHAACSSSGLLKMLDNVNQLVDGVKDLRGVRSRSERGQSVATP